VFFAQFGQYAGSPVVSDDGRTIKISLRSNTFGRVEIVVVNDRDGQWGWTPSMGAYNEQVSNTAYFEVR
jgi:hypothetical protein